MPEMLGKHKPNIRTYKQKTSKDGRQVNANTIAQVMMVMYTDNVFIIATASLLAQAKGALQNAMSTVDNWEVKNANRT